MGKCGIWNHSHQFPSCIADGIDDNLPVFSLKVFIINIVIPLGGGLVIFTDDPIADLYLLGMIYDLPAAVA